MNFSCLIKWTHSALILLIGNEKVLVFKANALLILHHYSGPEWTLHFWMSARFDPKQNLIPITRCHIISLIIIKWIGYTGHAIAYVVTVSFYVFHCFVSVLHLFLLCLFIILSCKFETLWLFGGGDLATGHLKLIKSYSVMLHTWYCFCLSLNGVLIQNSYILIKFYSIY